jgi:hypothetical protein
MSWLGLPRSGHSSRASLMQVPCNQKEEFDDFT